MPLSAESTRRRFPGSGELLASCRVQRIRERGHRRLQLGGKAALRIAATVVAGSTVSPRHRVIQLAAFTVSASSLIAFTARAPGMGTRTSTRRAT